MLQFSRCYYLFIYSNLLTLCLFFLPFILVFNLIIFSQFNLVIQHIHDFLGFLSLASPANSLSTLFTFVFQSFCSFSLLSFGPFLRFKSIFEKILFFPKQDFFYIISYLSVFVSDISTLHFQFFRSYYLVILLFYIFSFSSIIKKAWKKECLKIDNNNKRMFFYSSM